MLRVRPRLLKARNGLRAAIFRDVEIRLSEAANRLPFAVCYNHIDDYGAGLRLKSGDKGAELDGGFWRLKRECRERSHRT